MSIEAALETVASAAPAGAVPSRGATRLAGLITTVHDDLTVLRSEWLTLEATATGTPFQRFSWVEGWARHVAPTLGATPAITVVRDDSHAMVALFPLFRRREAGLQVARFAGGKHASYQMGLFAPAALDALSEPGALRGVLAGLRSGPFPVDLVMFSDQPALWRGRANPLLHLPHAASPSFGHATTLIGSGEEFLSIRLSSDARHKVRRKLRRLAELGALRFGKAETRTEALHVLDAFLSQKARRFREQGIVNPFDEPGARAFLTDAVTRDLEAGGAAISLFSLQLDDRVIASFGGALAGDQFCSMFNAFELAPEIARLSPGDILLMNMVQNLCDRGVRHFDLGVGEARYKETYCDRREALFDTVAPLSARAQATAAVAHARRGAKRWIKQTPWLMDAVRGVRRWRARA